MKKKTWKVLADEKKDNDYAEYLEKILNLIYKPNNVWGMFIQRMFQDYLEQENK